MAKIKKIVEFSTVVEVEFDTDKFTEEVMNEFSEVIFEAKTLDAHAHHLAQLCARGGTDGFVEGYGELESVGVKLKALDYWTEIQQ